MGDKKVDFRELFRRSLGKVQELKNRLESVERGPIAIVSMGCRYPGGVTDPESFWELLQEGRNAIEEVPASRWDVESLYDADPESLGKITTRRGGFLRDVDTFDPAFFGITPREAAHLDPQQRLVLETSWEALERAGILPERLMGSNTGAFIGHMYQDYATLSPTYEDFDGYVVTGSAASVASGRLSYFLGLKGPSLTVDTACSSSLVTLHLAVQALRRRECELAIAGGVAVMATPSTFIEFSRLRGLAPDGQCKTFSAAADGVAWSEGCGVLVLKRLEDAQCDGNPVLAVIRASAVNHDGRSNGLTAPNGPSQQAVIHQALTQAGLSPSDVDYVECHGTGTRLGDPIEVQALGNSLSQGRDKEHPLLIGSVKTNLGHTQAAAGAAGVIKAVLALQHDRIPKNLHFDAPSPHIPWSELRVKVVSEEVEWPKKASPRRAGVSSFGISGTNAHVIIEEAPTSGKTGGAQEPDSGHTELFVLSAKSRGALQSKARQIRDLLATDTSVSLRDVAFSLASTRSAMDERVTVARTSRESLIAALDAAASGQFGRGVSRGHALHPKGKRAFLFTGQGSHRLGMGRALYNHQPAFREALDACFGLFDELLDRPLRDVLWAVEGSGAAEYLQRTGYAQPALFAVEYALVALLASWGVRPQLVAGHSIGEIGAACIAGVFTLQDAVRLVAARGRLMQSLPEGSGMLSVFADESSVLEFIAGTDLSVAAVNAPGQIVVAGPNAAITQVAGVMADAGVRAKTLRVSHAFHSPAMEPMLDAFREVAESITYRMPSMAMVSNLTGALVTDEVTKADYWVRHVREAVRFADGVASLWQAGARTFVEVGPRGVLLGMVGACLPEEEPTFIPCMRERGDEQETVLEALGTLWTQGHDVDWKGVFPASGNVVPLPTYPFERGRYWFREPRIHAMHTHAAQPADPTDNLMYEVAWAERRRSSEPDGAEATKSTWLIYDDEEIGASVCAELEMHGARCIRVVPGDGYGAEGNRYTVRPHSVHDAQRMLREALTTEGPTVKVLQLWGLREKADNGGIGCMRKTQTCALVGSLQLLKALVGHSFPQAPTLWFATRGVHHVPNDTGAVNVAASTLWGLGRTIAAEHTDLWGGLIDLPVDVDDRSVALQLIHELVSPEGEEELALRTHGRYATRLRPAPARRSYTLAVQRDAAYLISGGLGALGLQIADQLGSKGAGTLVLVGRRSLPPREAWDGDLHRRMAEKIAAVRALEARGIQVFAESADVADEESLHTLLGSLQERGCPPIRGVVHAAAQFHAAPLVTLEPADLLKPLDAKVYGAMALERALPSEGLDFFVLLSSVAGTLPSLAEGLGGYAAGNAALDAIAQQLRASGVRATSFDAGPWAKGASGNAVLMDKILRFFKSIGVEPFSSGLGMAAMLRAIESGAPQLWGIDIDWKLARGSADSKRPILSEMWGPDDQANADRADVLAQALSRSGEERSHFVRDYVRTVVAHTVRMAKESVPVDSRVSELGLDSLMAVELRRKLDSTLGVTVPVLNLLEGISISEMANMLSPLLQSREVVVRGAATVAHSDPSPVASPTPAFSTPMTSDRATSQDGALVIPNPVPDAERRLFCFAYAGGGPPVYYKWAEFLPAGVELCAVQLPGRGTRIKEAPFKRMEQVVESLIVSLRSYLDRPFAFFGHCLGAVEMFELTHLLKARHDLLPLHLFVSGARAPQTYTPEQIQSDVIQFSPNPGVPGHLLPEEEFLDLARALNFQTSSALYDDVELRRLLLPMVQADFEVNNTYTYRAKPKINVPITAVGGRSDPFVSGHQLIGWREQTESAFEIYMRPGDHYFIETQRDFWLQLLEQKLGVLPSANDSRRRM